MDIQISDEQSNIVKQFQKGHHLTILAVAGAGKTTTILILAQNNPNEEIIVLTYNRRLSDETKIRINKWNLGNIEMQTYHGFCTKYFGSSYNDVTMSKLINSLPQISMSNRLQKFTTLIIDEMQDMNDLYYNFIHNKLSYFNANLKIVLLGDPHQIIYQFNGGNDKYLLNPQHYWDRPFHQCVLETTYRLPSKITNVVNTLICSKYQQPFKMQSTNKTPNLPVEYHFIDLYHGGQKIIINQINQYGLDGVLLIALSVKEKTPIYECLNQLSKLNINMCVLKDDEPINSEILKNKLLASTIHKQKGCERQCVIIYGLDCSYHKYYGKNKSIDEYLNLIYVACTRSLEKLIILGHKKHNYLKTWHQQDIKGLILTGDLKVFGQSVGKCDCSLELRCQCQSSKFITVTDVIKYRSFYCLNHLIKHPSIQINEIKGQNYDLFSENKAQMKSGLIEQVSTIYGVLIPIIVEYHYHKQVKMIDYILSEQFISDFQQSKLIDYLNKDKRYEINSIYNKIKKSLEFQLDDLIAHFITDFTFLSICILCHDSYVYLLNQIDTYDWIEIQYVKECCLRLIEFKEKKYRQFEIKENQFEIKENQVEKRITYIFDQICLHPEKVNIKMFIYGRVDDLINNIPMEYKISKNLGDHLHIAQLLIYLWILKKSSGFLYYPNLDTSINIQISDFDQFNQHVFQWFNNLFIEYYQVELKSHSNQCDIQTPPKKNKIKLIQSNGCLL